jgi:hypothetical protein
MITPAPAGLPEVEIPNRHVADAAMQFRETADLLFRQLTRHNCVLPLLMVASFAIELFLKSLNTRNVYHDLRAELGIAGYRVTAAPIQKGHSLVQLFDSLDLGIQKQLTRAYDAHPLVPNAATVREALLGYDKIFLDARYPFEDRRSLGQIDLSSLVRLAGIIGDFVDGLVRGRLGPECSTRA